MVRVNNCEMHETMYVDKEPGTSVLHSEPHEMGQINPAINAMTMRQETPHKLWGRSGAEDFPSWVLRGSLQFPSICGTKRSCHTPQQISSSRV